MGTEIAGHQSLIIVDLGIAVVPHITHRQHPMGRQREFQQSEGPVALVIFRRQILQLSAQLRLGSQLVEPVGNEDVRVNHPTLAFNDCLIVLLIHVHHIQFEVFAQLARQLYVEVLIVGGAFPAHVRKVYLDIHAVLAAEGRLALEIIACLSLPGPLAVCQLSRIGIKGCQGISLVLREGRQMIDEG